jgi:hypothetical protein
MCTPSARSAFTAAARRAVYDRLLEKQTSAAQDETGKTHRDVLFRRLHSKRIHIIETHQNM